MVLRLAACMATMAKKKPNLAAVSVSTVQRQHDAKREDCARSANHAWNSRQFKIEPDSSYEAIEQSLRTGNTTNRAGVPAELNPLQDWAGTSGKSDWAPAHVGNGSASCEDQVSGDRLWQNLFTDPSEWWDNRSNKLHFKSPDFRHMITKEDLWIDSWNTPEWVKQVFRMESPSKKVSEGTSRIENGSDGAFTTATKVQVITAQCDVFSWTARIFQHAKCGQGKLALRLYKEMQEAEIKPNSCTFVAALKACSSLRDFETAKRLHSEVVRCGFETDVYIGTMLIDVYAKCGRLMDARGAFDRMLHRDVVSWNALILGHAQLEQGEEALQLYAQMQQESFLPNNRTFVAALKACSSLAGGSQADGILRKNRCLEQVRAIHSHVLRSGSEMDVFVGNMLVDAYAKCGSLKDARCVFEKMPRDVVSWNVMILGYVQKEKGEEALELYARMQKEGVVPDDRTFVGALKACSTMAVSTVDYEVDRKDMKTMCLEQVRSIHSELMKSGSATGVFVGTMLVDTYAKCGVLGDARDVFEKMPHRDVVAWNAMILGYAQMDNGDEALLLYARMQQEGVIPDDQTFVSALKACSSLATLRQQNEADGGRTKQQCLKRVKIIHSQVKKRGSELGSSVGNMLVDVYAKCGSLVDARCIFEKMSRRDVVSWNAMILGYAQMEEGDEALRLYTRMKQEDVIPDDRTFVGALKGCSAILASEEGTEADMKGRRKQHLQKVRSIHSDIVDSGRAMAVCVGTMLVDVYSKCGSLVDARHIFEKMPWRDVVAWTAMIFGYLEMEEGEEALALYARMHCEGVVPDERTFVGALKASGAVAGLEQGKGIHGQILQSTVVSTDSFLASSLVDMYGKCGSMADAQQVFSALCTRDAVTWNALIAGYARQGSSDLVFEWFDRMRSDGIQPNEITFLSVLSVCSHVGLVEKGEKYFEAMKRDYSINPTIEHYSCMIDLLGRGGKLRNAMEILTSMPFQPPAQMWRCLLGSCRKWTNVELGRHAFECAVRLDKNDAAAYALMSNIYLAAHMQEDASKIQAMRIEARAWSQPGQSRWTDIGGVVHAFLVGDQLHPESHYIYAKLRDLLVKMQEEGITYHQPQLHPLPQRVVPAVWAQR